MLTEITGAAVTVTAAEAEELELAMLVAVTVKLPGDEGAVYMPEEFMVPPLADQVTEVLELPVTVALNCCEPPVETEAVGGFTETVTA